jgi:hypothetical protein
MVLFLASASGNVFLYIKLKQVRSQPSYEARMLIHDLTAGDALVRVTRVAPEEVLLRSPRHL